MKVIPGRTRRPLRVGKPRVAATPITPESLAASDTEHGHQSAVFCWCAINRTYYPETRHMFAIPNGGLRHIVTATKLKAEGVKDGVSDIMLPVPKHNCHGMFIEMKKPEYRTRKNGGRSAEQIRFQNDMIQQGYHCVTCYGWFEAVAAICAYLGWANLDKTKLTV